MQSKLTCYSVEEAARRLLLVVLSELCSGFILHFHSYSWVILPAARPMGFVILIDVQMIEQGEEIRKWETGGSADEGVVYERG